VFLKDEVKESAVSFVPVSHSSLHIAFSSISVPGIVIMAKRSRAYIWQFVIGFGFLSGIWTALGIDPGEVIFNALGTVTETIFPDPTLRQVFIIIPTILFLVSVCSAYKKGRIPGLAAVVIAYLAGLSILISLGTTIVLLLAAVVIGYLATRRRYR
jgi:hypothetical protein